MQGKVRFTGLSLQVHDLQGMLRFYREALGVQAVDGDSSQPPPGGEGACRLILRKLTNDSALNSHKADACLLFEGDEIPDVELRVLTMGGSIAGRVKVFSNELVHGTDPEGNRFSLVMRPLEPSS